MKIAAIIPVKTFENAKTRLELDSEKKQALCKVMLEEILHTISISPHIDEMVIVTKDSEAIKIAEKFKGIGDT